MDNKTAAKILEALSHEIRLNVYRLLVKHSPDGLVQGDIAKLVGLPPPNLSFHLRAIVQSGLASAKKEGRYMRYKADVTRIVEVVGFLTRECCGGKPELCLGPLEVVFAKKGSGARKS